MLRRVLPFVLCSSLGAGTTACDTGASADPALDAWMRVESAQFVAGAPPASSSGPGVASLELVTNSVWPGYWNKLLRGSLAPHATAVALGLAGDRGYWLVGAQAPDVAAPELPTFRATAELSATLPVGGATLEVRGVDASGAFGPLSARSLTVLGHAPSSPPAEGMLVVSLGWDTQADLDLHVVDPLGDEIFHGAKSSEDGFTPGADTAASGGLLDADSNAGCVLDGQRQENVSWVEAPPVGQYLVRIDANSLCAEAIAHYSVEVTHAGSRLARVTGVAVESDTRGPHDRGAGVLALTFEVP